MSNRRYAIRCIRLSLGSEWRMPAVGRGEQWTQLRDSEKNDSPLRIAYRHGYARKKENTTDRLSTNTH
jgi:hypothetical protein